ncbi:MAG: M28 family peptidase [Alistipes sp.]|nr:M28 family peptidase [Alistipes sp.]
MKRLFVVLLSFFVLHVGAQDLSHYKRVVKELSSAKYKGRGYAFDGANKAGEYLAKEFEKAGVDEVVCQPFKLDINTFPGKMKFTVDGKKLVPGVDFTMREFSPGAKGEYKLYYIDTLNYNSAKIFEELALPENKDVFVVCDFWFTYKHTADFKRLQSKEGCQNAGLIYTWNEPTLKFYKAYGERVIEKPMLWVNSSFPTSAKSIKLDIENEFLKDNECFNVIAKVEGKRHDKCYLFTAHYDHLGVLGKKTFYAGAHDNASGTATIVTLAAHYAKNKPEYDIYFVAFSGEDAYLRGSEWFAEHPSAPLQQVRYLINLDMIADNNPVQYCEASDEGMKGYELFEKINTQKGYFKSLNRAPLAGNSDHYPFAQRGVPCIFLMNEGGDAHKYYHTIYDTWENSLFDNYEPIFKLVVDFIEQY